MNIKWFLERSLVGMDQAKAMESCDEWPPLAVYCYTTGLAKGLAVGLFMGGIVASVIWLL